MSEGTQARSISRFGGVGEKKDGDKRKGGGAGVREELNIKSGTRAGAYGQINDDFHQIALNDGRRGRRGVSSREKEVERIFPGYGNEIGPGQEGEERVGEWKGEKIVRYQPEEKMHSAPKD